MQDLISKERFEIRDAREYRERRVIEMREKEGVIPSDLSGHIEVESNRLQAVDKGKPRYIRPDVFLCPFVREITPCCIAANAGNSVITDPYLVAGGSCRIIADSRGIVLVAVIDICAITHCGIIIACYIAVKRQITTGGIEAARCIVYKCTTAIACIFLARRIVVKRALSILLIY